MKPRFIVTKGSDDGTFEIGDNISFDDDGSIILHAKEGGRIDTEDVPEATKGMEYKVDMEWVKRRQRYIKNMLADLEEIIVGINGGDAE
jgi:hypothetical protein